jgi:AraC-like DNA-binding protein
VAQCRDLLARRQARAGLCGQVRDLLLARPAQPPNAEQVAAALHMGARTLRERLTA